MVVLTGRISKGTLMDQIYIPKERPLGFAVGASVILKPLIEDDIIKPVYCNTKKLESVKVMIIQKIFNELNFADNVIVTGSFLEKGFNFNDVDIILIDNGKINPKELEKRLNKAFSLSFHITAIDYSALIKGLETDPLYQAMLSKYVAKKRAIFKYKNRINYKILDLHLMKSKPLIENFDYLTGNQKYNMARNMMAITLFINNKKINNETVDIAIKRTLKEEPINIKQNIIIDKSIFLKEYKKSYNKLFDIILGGIKNGP